MGNRIETNRKMQCNEVPKPQASSSQIATLTGSCFSLLQHRMRTFKSRSDSNQSKKADSEAATGEQLYIGPAARKESLTTGPGPGPGAAQKDLERRKTQTLKTTGGSETQQPPVRNQQPEEPPAKSWSDRKLEPPEKIRATEAQDAE